MTKKRSQITRESGWMIGKKAQEALITAKRLKEWDWEDIATETKMTGSSVSSRTVQSLLRNGNSGTMTNILRIFSVLSVEPFDLFHVSGPIKDTKEEDEQEPHSSSEPAINFIRMDVRYRALETFDEGTIESIVGLLNISPSDLALLVMKARDEQASRTTSITNMVNNGRLMDALKGYYTAETLGSGDLALYNFTNNGTTRTVSVATKQSWTELRRPLSVLTEQKDCTLVSPTVAAVEPLVLPQCKQYAAQYLAQRIRKEQTVWDSSIYRLRQCSITRSELSARFSVDSFIQYRFSIGFLLEEMTNALINNRGDLDAILDQRDKYLPMRHHLLKDGKALVQYDRRMCAGGTLALVAVARSAPYNDYCLYLQRRSSIVADAPEMLSVIPKAFHSPLVAPESDVQIWRTIIREMYEELFGGREEQREIEHLHVEPYWFYSECRPLRWLLRHPQDVSLEYTGFGLNLATGNYEFALLAAIHDPIFYSLNKDRFLMNWETRKFEQYSSRDKTSLTALLNRSDWTGEGLFAFAEGLKRLKEISPDKVEWSR